MLEDLRNEMHSFLNDINNNIKDKEDLIYIRERTEKLLDVVLDNIEKIADYKRDELDFIIKKQEITDAKLRELKERLDNVYEDIYDEEGFTVVCPYCNCEFDEDIDETVSEIRCPECNNLIELDWNGNPDDDESNSCGDCSHCGGCE